MMLLNPWVGSLSFRSLVVVLLTAAGAGGSLASGDCVPAQLVDGLETQFVDRVLIEPASPPLSLAQGMCAQGLLVARLSRRLGPVVGYKAGLTSPAIRSRLSVKEPLRGTLLRDMLLSSDAFLPRAFGARGFLEMDLVVVVGDGDALQSTTDPVAASAHVKALHAFIELPDWVFRDPLRVGAGDIAAANVGARAGVLGPRIEWPRPATGLSGDAAWRHRLLAGLRLSLRDSRGQLVAAGPASLLDGHPMNVVVWLAQHLKAQGVVLRAGDLLSLGSVGPPIDPAAGETYTQRLEGLDSPELVLPGQVGLDGQVVVRFLP